MELSRLTVGLILISVLSFARAQVDCPAFNISDLGATDMLTQGGLVGSAIAAVSGDPTRAVSVQVHDSNIVCLRSGRTQDTYSGVSVVVDYTCSGAFTECTGNRILSQFEFECVANPVRWAPSVDGSASNIITTPPDGSLSTTPRTDCGVCISPARSIFATITNNDQHCGSCNSACSVGLMRCFNRLDSGCCDFFVNDTCVINCTFPLVPNSNFDCVVDCGLLSNITNGMVIYNAQGQDQTLMGANVTYTCITGYTLSGSSMRTCQADGAWSGSNPTCDIVDCGLLMNPTNGMVTLQGTTFGQEATYTCNSMYDLVGDGTRTCLANGSWSGTDPTCDLQCQNGGTFNAGMGICECPIAFTGIDCSGVMCRPPCQNGGTCDTSNGTCRCPAGYGGSDCSVTCDPPCMDGFCVIDECVRCPAGYFGVNCTETCSSKVMGCTMCVNGTNNLPNCTQCEAGTTLDPQTNECKSAPIIGGCGPGCIAGAIIGALLGAALLAAIAAAIIYALYKHFSAPATQIKTGDTAGLNGVAKDNPLYVDPTTVEAEVGEDAAAAVGDA